MDPLNVIVIGAGIGGLAAARALAMQGCQVTVLEQAEAIREVGAGLQISPNGFCVLEALGLSEPLRRVSTHATAVELRDYRGANVARFELRYLENSEYHFLHRADLISILADGAREAGVTLELGHQVQAVTPGTPTLVQLSDGRSMSADLVVGADGLHSIVRQNLHPSVQPFFTGQVAWRAIVPNTSQRGAEVRVHMGPHRHIVSYPLRDGASLNLVAVKERATWQDESWSQKDTPENLRAAFQDFGAEVQEMLRLVEEVHLWGLFRHPVARRWHDDGIALLGDAAHPMLPFLAQGATMALEDAWVLAQSLSLHGSLQTRLAAYQTRRFDRATRVVDAASGNAWKYHLSLPPVRFAAHLALRMGSSLAPQRMMRQFSWLYDHDVTQH